MKFAVISDIHSNIAALKAVVSDIKAQEIDRIYCTGDLVGYAPFPNEVIDFIREKQIPTVMGNYDDAIGNMRFICGCDYKDENAQALGEASILWTKQHTSEKNKEFLRSLPEEIRFEAAGEKVLLVHGSPGVLNEYIYENLPSEQLSGYLEKGNCDILICGHTHRPFHLSIAGGHIINAGSVGKPKHGDPSSTYVIVDINEKVSVETRTVSYDYEAVSQAIQASGLPDEFADFIRKGIG